MKGGSFTLATSTAVDEAAERADRQGRRGSKWDRHAVAEGELPHDDGGEHHDGADREVDAGGQDDQRLRRADDADDRDLLQDERQRKGGEELAADQHAEDGNREDQHDQRHRRRA